MHVSRLGDPCKHAVAVMVTFADDAHAALAAFLGVRADLELGPVAQLRPPAAAWGEQWAEMLADALVALSREPPPPR